MTTIADGVAVRPADLAGDDADAVARLVGDYLRQTEREKALHLHGATLAETAELPPAYRAETTSPRTAYADAVVHLAEIGPLAAGVVVLRRGADGTEVKRLWADPAFRGRGVGSALVDTALGLAQGPVRLSVWDWRDAAIRLYESRGFARVPSWDPRPRLVCMTRSG